MKLRADILGTLTASRNGAVERAIADALAESAPDEQEQLADVLLERNRRAGWVALIRAYDRLDESVRRKILARPRDLFGPLAETMQDSQGASRENVIAIVQACADARLVYLLAEALMDARPAVRELAGKSFFETVRRCCYRPAAPALPALPTNGSPIKDESFESTGASPSAAPSPLDPDDVAQIARAVDFALRKYKTHRQTLALHAALIHERQQDAVLWSFFEDPYDDITRAVTVTLRAPSDPAIIPALFLALASPVKSAAMAGLAALESPALAAAAAAESFRLLDPLLRDAARGVSHLKLLPALRKDPPWNLSNWHSWLGLIDSVGLQPQEKLTWLVRLFESAPPGKESAAWKTCTLRAIADTAQPEAGTTLANALRDPDERVARCAARFLGNHRIIEWRSLAAAMFPKSPHLSVRNMAQGLSTPQPAARKTTSRVAEAPVERKPAAGRSFDKTWNDYQKMPPVVQHNTARSVANDPAFALQLREKLASGSVPELSQGLRMLAALPSLTAYRTNIITLCGHADPRIAAQAVRLVGRLEDPRLKDLLDAAMQHADARVRANAIESLEELHVVDRSQTVLTMLNSRHQRERANAIRAIGQFNFATARECLTRMLADPNPLHRMSALWLVTQFNLLDVMRQVALIARRDPNLRVRNRAAEMVETLSGNLPSPHQLLRGLCTPHEFKDRPMQNSFTLAQASPWDDSPATSASTPATAPNRLSFSDLQQGLRAYNNGETNDTAFRNSILALMAVVAVIALMIHLRQRRKNAPPLDSLPALGRELNRQIRFPFATKFLLRWVARFNKVPYPALLISSAMFDKAVQNWSSQSAFSGARQWGRGRLERLRPVLFTG